jgi:hypothetical protein
MGATPDLSAPFTFIIPDLKHNAHDLGVRSADNWLKGYLPKVLDSPQYQAGRTAVFVFFDENGGGGAVPNPVPMFVMSPSTPAGARVGTHLTHYSTLRATQEMLGLGYLGNSGSAADMRAGFRLR